ncbi:MAG: 23S rRNA (adenine(2503)-C(2))-methyltransferase RlmN, partial [Nevskia sp.]|nr:23S rRNA (adenine(2503)-C(2))-methyltransferase RlmN [Nevskia sp.]
MSEAAPQLPESAVAADARAGGAAAADVPAGPTVNLFGLNRERLREEFARMGEAAYRADQVMQWIYRRGVSDFDAMSNIAKDLRLRLKRNFVIRPPELVVEQVSTDGTRKWVLRLDASPEPRGADAAGRSKPETFIETVYIPEANRGTLCISSQAGCAMDCSFCSTAQGGFSRNMSTAEIVAQVWFAAKTLGGDFQNERVISNVVFMGLGEPLA